MTLVFSFELQTQLILMKELQLIFIEKADSLIKDLIEIKKMIYSFKNNLTI
ncbi:four helix bundle protein [Chryseobacterium sp.]|uniref:four helix bundle protein n=1 Tax=Chryseobacterium sp. TaxID=1871047 RepID=UPI00388DDA2E